MKYRKFLTNAILTSVICLLTVLAFTTEKADAWGWYGFSSLCVDDAYKGKNGAVIYFDLVEAIVNTQCYNVNTGNFDQPGTGNAGDELEPFKVISSLTKVKGVVSVDGCIDLRVFDHHDGFCVEGEDGVQNGGSTPPCDDDDVLVDAHIHTCHPVNNINKEELPDTAWIGSFVASWIMYDKDPDDYIPGTPGGAKIVNSGTDTCTWNGGFDNVDGVPIPEHNVPFECESTSDKPIKFVIEE